MKKVFILLLLILSFQGFLLAQENTVDAYGIKDSVELRGNAMDDFDLMLDSADNAIGDIKPVAAPQKHSVNLLAVCAYLIKKGLKVTYENLAKVMNNLKQDHIQ